MELGSTRWKSESNAPTDEDHQRARQIVASLFDRFDANGDGSIDRDELPSTFRVFAFGRYDVNRDQVITQEEVYKFALGSDV